MDETQADEGVAPGGMTTHRTRQPQSRLKYDDCSTSTFGSAGAGTPSSRGNTPNQTQASAFNGVLHEIQELQENQGQLEECFENLKAHYQREYTVIVEALQEEQYRCEHLEEELKDLTELHQNEILNLKEEIASLEEMIAYQSHEGATDIYEALEACQKRLFKLEQQQQVEQLEGLENITPQDLLGKLTNMLLGVMAVLLVSVSTIANCFVLLMKTYNRMLSTLLFVLLLSCLWRHWDAISEYLHHFLLSIL